LHEKNIRKTDYFDILSKNKIINEKVKSSIILLNNTYKTLKSESQSCLDNEYIDSMFCNFKIVIKWFYTNYISLSTAQFDRLSIQTKENTLVYDEFRVVGLADLKDINWSYEYLLEQLINIDFQNMQNLQEEDEGDVSFWLPIIKSNTDTLKLVLDNDNKIIGYWHFIPLFDEYFDLSVKGELLDTDINCEMIPQMIPGIYDIYFASIVIIESHKKSIIFKMLLDSLAKTLEDLADYDVYINKISTIAYSSDGKTLARSLGLKYNADGIKYGKIYTGDISDLLKKRFCNNYTVLKNMYSEVIEEIC
jgi:hypothetical protein